jgi:hypothetical protein
MSDISDIEDRIQDLYKCRANIGNVADILFMLLEKINELERKLKEKTEPQEPKMPPLFSNLEWLGDKVRVHVFQRREDKTPLNVHSSTHDVPKEKKEEKWFPDFHESQGRG